MSVHSHPLVNFCFGACKDVFFAKGFKTFKGNCWLSTDLGIETMLFCWVCVFNLEFLKQVTTVRKFFPDDFHVPFVVSSHLKSPVN